LVGFWFLVLVFGFGVEGVRFGASLPPRGEDMAGWRHTVSFFPAIWYLLILLATADRIFFSRHIGKYLDCGNFSSSSSASAAKDLAGATPSTRQDTEVEVSWRIFLQTDSTKYR